MTLRENLEAIRAERDRVQSGDIFEAYVLSMRRVTAHADDALAILNAAPRSWLASEGFVRRNVPDGIWPNPDGGVS